VDAHPVSQQSVSEHLKETDTIKPTSGLDHPFFVHYQTPGGKGTASSTLALCSQITMNISDPGKAVSLVHVSVRLNTNFLTK